jgi:hypothetical protein
MDVASIEQLPEGSDAAVRIYRYHVFPSADRRLRTLRGK